MKLSLLPLAWILVSSIVSGEVSFYQPSVRSPRQSEIIYFLLPDRFNDDRRTLPIRYDPFV
jgi:hypothetical protein